MWGTLIKEMLPDAVQVIEKAKKRRAAEEKKARLKNNDHVRIAESVSPETVDQNPNDISRDSNGSGESGESGDNAASFGEIAASISDNGSFGENSVNVDRKKLVVEST